jgi:hypothetical protein
MEVMRWYYLMVTVLGVTAGLVYGAIEVAKALKVSC